MLAFARAQFPGRDGTNRSSDLWVVASNGSSPRRVTSCGDVSYFPIVWSPGGETIAFVRRHYPDRRSPTSETLSLWRAAKSSDSVSQLLSWDDLGHPVSASWIAPSPDLREVAVVPEQSQSHARPLIVVDVAAHQSRRVAEGDLGYPTWSFDGKRLAYVKDGSEIWVTSGRSGDPGKLIWKVPEEQPSVAGRSPSR